VSKKPDDNSKKAKIDPRLRRFLSRAVPVIAEERGINERSMLKIRSIADELRLPVDLYQEGLRKLKRVGTGQKLNRYERDFVRYLRRQFRTLSTPILTISMERKASEFAQAKYQLSQERAAEIITQQAMKYNIGRISRSEAERHVESMIADRIKSATLVDEETQQRLYAFGLEWGIEEPRVDSILNQILSENRSIRNRQNRVFTPLALVLTVAVAAVAGFGIYLKSISNDDSLDTVAQEEMPTTDVVPFPSWWPQPQQVEFAKIATSDSQFRELIPNLASESTELRRIATMHLAEMVIASQFRGENERLKQAFFEILARDPDLSVKQAILKNLFQKIRVDQILDSNQSVRESYDANLVVYELFQFLQPGSGIKDECALDMLAKTSVDPRSNTEYLTLSNRAIAVAHLTQQNNHIWSQSDVVIGTLTKVLVNSSKHMSTSSYRQWRSDIVFGLLEAAPAEYDKFSEHIAACIEDSEPWQLTRWLDVWEASQDPELSSYIENFLAVKLDIKLRNISPEKRLAAMRRAATGIESSGEKFFARAEVWEAIATKFIQDNPIAVASPRFEFDRLPKRTAKAISLVTAGVVLLHSQSRNDYRDFDRFMQSLNDQAELPSSNTAPVIKFGATTGPASQWEIKLKENCIQTIKNAIASNSGTEQDGPNPATVSKAIRDLADTADKFPDLEHGHAVIVAKFCFSNLNDDQLISVEQSLPKMSHWLSLHFALLDEIDNSLLPRQKSCSVVDAIADTEFVSNDTISRNPSWKKQLQRLFLKNINQTLESQTRPLPANGDVWDRLFQNLARNYSVRLSTTGLQTTGFESEAIDQEIGESRLSTLPNRILSFFHSKTNPTGDLTAKLKRDSIDSKIENDASALRLQFESDFEQIVSLETRVVRQRINRLIETGDKELLQHLSKLTNDLDERIDQCSNLAEALYVSEFYYLQLLVLELKSLKSRVP